MSNMTLPPNPWLVRKPGPTRRLRLYCFCYAGGSAAAYANWQAGLDPSIEVIAVELPGRGMRFGEQPMTSLALVSDIVAQLIGRQGSTPFAFFGHSLGALLAFEVARRLQQLGLPMPVHVFASGASAPQHRRKMDVHLLDDDALIAKLKEFAGTPPGVLESRELMELLLPMLRADFAMAGEYTYRSGPLLGVPLTVLMGRDDENAEGLGVDGWKKETSGPFEVEWFDGGHFFVQPKRDAVLACIQAGLLKPAFSQAV
jgi:surfactin synthase thioesterase subunit